MRLYIGRNSIPKFRGKLFEYEDLKTTEIGEIGPGSTQECAYDMELHYHAPRASMMRLGHCQKAICTLSICCAPQASQIRGEHA